MAKTHTSLGNIQGAAVSAALVAGISLASHPAGK